jgi:hypothetical protein
LPANRPKRLRRRPQHETALSYETPILTDHECGQGNAMTLPRPSQTDDQN